MEPAVSQKGDKLADIEQEVVAWAVEIAALKARMGSIEQRGKLYSPDLARLKRLEADEKHLIDRRNALSKQVADEHIDTSLPWTRRECLPPLNWYQAE